MAKKESTEEVLQQIFDQSIRFPKGLDHGFNPEYDEIKGLAELLGLNVREEALQQYLSKHPSFLCGMMGYHYQNEVAFLTKPRIGKKYVADFLIITHGQGGIVFHFVELEAAHHPILTKEGIVSAPYNKAIKQIEDWDRWIQKNTPSYTNELLKDCDQLPTYPKKSSNHSFKLYDDDIPLFKLGEITEDFQRPRVNYTIIMGRWSKFSSEEREQLAYDNENKKYNLYTYEQLIRKSLARYYTPLP